MPTVFNCNYDFIEKSKSFFLQKTKNRGLFSLENLVGFFFRKKNMNNLLTLDDRVQVLSFIISTYCIRFGWKFVQTFFTLDCTNSKCAFLKQSKPRYAHWHGVDFCVFLSAHFSISGLMTVSFLPWPNCLTKRSMLKPTFSSKSPILSKMHLMQHCVLSSLGKLNFLYSVTLSSGIWSDVTHSGRYAFKFS